MFQGYYLYWFCKKIIGKEDLNSFMKYKCDIKYLNMPLFYLQLFHYWYELHSRPPENAHNMLDEYIWYNKRILISNKPIYYDQWYKKGIKRVNNVMKLNGTFYTPNELSVRHGINIDLMMYNSVISAIPKEWKKEIRESDLVSYTPLPEDKIVIKIGNRFKELFMLTCKEVYNEFVKCKTERPTALYTWEDLYYYANFDWKLLFKIPYKVARETDLQSLQYQIINRYIPCYSNLKLWGKEQSDKCPFCSETDTVEHFFTQCLNTVEFWTNMNAMFHVTYDISITLKALDILLGIPYEDDFFTIVNYCILYGKKYIYDCRINSEVANFDMFVRKLIARIEIEIMLLECGKERNIKELWISLYNQLVSCPNRIFKK